MPRRGHDLRADRGAANVRRAATAVRQHGRDDGRPRRLPVREPRRDMPRWTDLHRCLLDVRRRSALRGPFGRRRIDGRRMRVRVQLLQHGAEVHSGNKRLRCVAGVDRNSKARTPKVTKHN
jgi:hypothetical protein